MSDVAIFLVDDDEGFLTATSRMLKAAGFKIHAFGSATGLLGHVNDATRGCIVADLNMPEIDGLELQGRLTRSDISMPIVFLTGQADIPSTVRAMREGAVDFLEKHATKEQLLGAIKTALERDAAGHAARMRQQELRARFDRLTKREREVLQYVVSGKLNKEIAAALDINERTVKLHRTAVTTKLGVHSVAQLTMLAREARLFADDVPKGRPR